MRNQYKVLFEKYQLVTEQTEEPVMTIDRNGTKEWYLNGELHRTDGPAMELIDGTKAWFLNGELHRTDGPAVEDHDGYKEWYLNGVEYTEEEWKDIIERERLKELGNKQAGANIDF